MERFNASYPRIKHRSGRRCVLPDDDNDLEESARDRDVLPRRAGRSHKLGSEDGLPFHDAPCKPLLVGVIEQ